MRFARCHSSHKCTSVRPFRKRARSDSSDRSLDLERSPNIPSLPTVGYRYSCLPSPISKLILKLRSWFTIRFLFRMFQLNILAACLFGLVRLPNYRHVRFAVVFYQGSRSSLMQ